MNKKAIVAELMMSKPSGKGCRYCGHKVRHLARCLCADSCGNDNFPR